MDISQSLKYMAPEGPIYYKTSTDVIIQDIDENEGAYFGRGECFGLIEIGKEKQPSDYTLAITYKDNYGYYIEYADCTEEVIETFNPVTSDSRTESIKHWVGQDFLRLCREFFVTKAQLISIVRVFCDSGQRDDSIQWLKHSESDWLFYDPNDQSP